tara:strand:+ start:524 stop:763 length:240 start_codon:yes stop_codon:yes gene_type:complete
MRLIKKTGGQSCIGNGSTPPNCPLPELNSSIDLIGMGCHAKVLAEHPNQVGWRQPCTLRHPFNRQLIRAVTIKIPGQFL